MSGLPLPNATNFLIENSNIRNSNNGHLVVMQVFINFTTIYSRHYIFTSVFVKYLRQRKLSGNWPNNRVYTSIVRSLKFDNCTFFTIVLRTHREGSSQRASIIASFLILFIDFLSFYSLVLCDHNFSGFWCSRESIERIIKRSPSEIGAWGSARKGSLAEVT